MAAGMIPGYHSTAEYHFCDEQADAICRTAAYHRKDYSLALIWFSAREHTDIRSSIATPFRTTADRGLGSLNRLPLELWYDVLLRLDMQSLFKLRQTSLGSREWVDSLHQYQMVVSHGLNLFCALLRTRLADSVSLAGFYSILCTEACELCGEFTGYISLLTWKRCCFQCLQVAPELRLQTLAATRKQFHLTKVETGQLRSFKTLPGIYSMDELPQKSRIAVICVHQAIPVVKKNAPALGQPVGSSRSNKLNFMGAIALPYYDRGTGKIEHGLSCAGCQLAIEKDIIGTRGEKWAFEARDKVYSRHGFLEHFRWCEQAHGLWRSSGEGAHVPSDLPEGARRGGYFNLRE
ncbi:F-box domain protein [Beauveria bassiana ARSEF 2860]|uniref:F-box domain protein n=1 Tax=Beauveria bassiana (strain ARSEF 2860) TaxID=655819 RepID=J5K342_BEAB2|nr:F-box domain protein [Beauveria bassiana ARSEF 2860]EJP70738.1 F-box domain protein [Beauveria bassiana ARSEF 2860]